MGLYFTIGLEFLSIIKARLGYAGALYVRLFLSRVRSLIGFWAFMTEFVLKIKIRKKAGNLKLVFIASYFTTLALPGTSKSKYSLTARCPVLTSEKMVREIIESLGLVKLISVIRPGKRKVSNVR